MKNIEHTSLWASLAMYAACLFFPAFYIGITHEPQGSLSLLLMGWVGLLEGHFSWFANLCYLVAILNYRRPDVSAGVGFMALFIALTFLFHDDIMVSAAPAYKKIVGYGYGYFLWVTAIGLFSIAQLMKALPRNSPPEGLFARSFFCAGWLGVCIGLFIYHFYLREGSTHSLEQERSRVFSESCENAKYAIFMRDEKADSIFFDPDRGVEITQWEDGTWHVGFVGRQGAGKLNSGMIRYYEKAERNNSKTARYRRFYPNHEGTEVDAIQSSHSVVTKTRDLAESLNIYAAHIVIRNLESSQVVAETRYVLDKTNGRFCNGVDGGKEFSTSRFVTDALNLQRDHPSIQDWPEAGSEHSVNEGNFGR